MPQTRINCPNCHQPVTADIEQLIDVGQNPELKQRFLSGMVNYLECPFCKFEGNLSTLVVYHDPDKELLLHYIPVEMGLKRDEQEKMIGNLINRVVNNLPQEKRKAYLFKSIQTFTFQGLVEKVLEADGITKEMIEAQQKKIVLIQKLLESNPEKMPEIIRQENDIIDEEFFVLFRRLTEAALMGQEEATTQRLSQVQRALVENSTYGKELAARTIELQEVVKELQEAGDTLTREQLLEMILSTQSQMRIQAYVSLARPLIDYPFFQLLSEKIDRSRGEGRTRLAELRDTLLALTNQYDQELEARKRHSRDVLNQLLTEPDIRAAMEQLLPQIDNFFIGELESELELARRTGDLDRIGKLRQVEAILEEASAPPPEVELIEKMLGTKDPEELKAFMQENEEKMTPELLDLLANFSAQMNAKENPELHQKLGEINRAAIRFSMAKNFNN